MAQGGALKQYIYQDLGNLGGNYAKAFGINNQGQVVGFSDPGTFTIHAFVWGPAQNPAMQDLGVLSGRTQSIAHDINNQGQIPGWSGSPIRAVLWDHTQGNQIQDLGTLGGNSYGLGVNDLGQVVGVYYPDYPFIWDPVNHMQTLPGGNGYAWGINNAGEIVGEIYWGNAVFWDSNKQMTTIGSGIAYAISNSSKVVGALGGHGTPPGTAFMWDRSTEQLQTLGVGVGFGINIQGVVVGGSYWAGYPEFSAPPQSRAMVYDPTESSPVWRDLNTLVLNLPQGIILNYAMGINDSGKIVGFSTEPNPRAFLLTPIIEVNIDIKPGEEPNSINLGSNGKVPVAVMSSPTFNAKTVDPASVTLAGAQVALKGKGDKYMIAFSDVNGDGLQDLIVHVDTAAFQLSAGDTEALLEGKTNDGLCIRGTDTVRIVP
jgi:probable HAF family extracellular repeat protein